MMLYEIVNAENETLELIGRKSKTGGKYEKKISLVLVLAIVLSLCFSASLFGATIYPWGPNWWTPYTGYYRASNYGLQVYGLKYSQSTINTYNSLQPAGAIFSCANELEVRPIGGTTSFWVNPGKSLTGNLTSNLPGAYREFDVIDDVSIGSMSVALCNANTTYYGTFNLTAASGAPWNTSTYTFESEWGYFYPIRNDAMPDSYEQVYNRSYNTLYSW